MKKIFTLLSLMLFVGMVAKAQLISSDFETWSGGKPTGWGGSKTQINNDSALQDLVHFHAGLSSIKFINPSSTHKRYSTMPVQVKKDTNYAITFWARGSGNIRTGLFDGRTTGSGYATYNSYINVNSTSWTQYTQNITALTDTALAQFIFSIQSTTGTNDHLQIDDVTIGAAAPPSIDTVTIYQIQYTTDTTGNSPKMNQTIRTRGIVTAAYASGYWIQDVPGAWNGVYVYDLNNKPVVGDSIFLTANVSEYNKLTELTTVVGYQKLGVAANLPEPTVVTTSMVSSEAYEGVFVKVTQGKCTNINAGGGSFLIANGTTTCKVDKTLFTFVPTLNTYYNVTGVVHYSFSEFRLLPRASADIVVSTGINTSASNSSFSVRPNPATSNVYISSDKNIQKINIYNIAGQLIESFTGYSNEQTISVENLKSGLYIVSIEFADNSKSVKKLVKE